MNFQSVGMGGFQDQGTGVAELQDHGSELIDDDAYYVASPYVSCKDTFPVFGDGGYGNDYPTGYLYSCSTPTITCNSVPWRDQVNVDHQDPLVTCDPLWQQQCSSFESFMDSAGTASTFEERQAALVAQVLGRGVTVHEAVQAEQIQTPIGQVLGRGITVHDIEAVQAEPQNPIGQGPPQSILLSADSYKEPEGKRPRISCCAYPMEDVIKNLPRSSERSVGMNENSRRNISLVATEFRSEVNFTSPGFCGSSVSSLLENDSSEKKQTEYKRHRYPTIGLSVEPQCVAARLRRKGIRERNKEPEAKRPRISCCAYTIEDVIKKLQRGSERTVGMNENSGKNISLVATEFTSEVNFTSTGFCSSSVSFSAKRNA